mmetsp:Transcript_31334/g.51156  ORF Transcript_31334/g.51156 Transcript_31334/m.51156 type:complete len:98 (+) Transcript_31334:163-456(+)
MLALDGSIWSMVDQKCFRMPQTAMDSNVLTNIVLGSYVISLAAAHMLLCAQQQRPWPLHNNNGSVPYSPTRHHQQDIHPILAFERYDDINSMITAKK